MNNETLKNILVFLNRTQLTGNEAAAMVMAQQEIQAELASVPPPVPPAT